MSTKVLLLRLTEAAYDSDEMSLLCGVFPYRWTPEGHYVRDPDQDLSEELSRRVPPTWHRSILAILQHVAECKLMYMTQAFGPPPEPFPRPGETLAATLTHLAAAHRYVVACLEQLADADMEEPVPTAFHGESAANLFRVLAQHDISHGSQIEVLRELLQSNSR